MPEIVTPTAARLPRPRWLDPRFVLGIALVLGSVVAGSSVVAAADDTVEVWALKRDLAAGAPLQAGDIALAHVHLDGRESTYLGAKAHPAGLVLTRPMGAGELLASSAVAPSAPAAVRAVGVETSSAALGEITEHSVVDVYVVPEDRAASTGADDATSTAGATTRGLVPVLRGVPVRKVGGGGGAFSSSGSTSVTLEVPQSAVGTFLAAVAGGVVHLVEVPPAAGASS